MTAQGSDSLGAGDAPSRQRDTGGGPDARGLSLLWHVLPGLLALVLFLILIVVSDLEWTDVSRAFNALTPATLLSFLGLTALLLALSAMKWLRVMRRIGEGSAEGMGLRDAFFYTTIGASLSLVLVPHAATPVGRALGARLHGRAPPMRSAGASVFEQAFDGFAMLIFAGLGLVWLWPDAWPIVAAGALFGALAAGLALSGRLRLPGRLGVLTTGGLLSPGLLATLAAISLLRYALVAARALILAAPAGIALPVTDFLASFSIVQVSRLVAVTPMGLGVTDWTWAGVLSLLAVPLSVAAGFVLLSRVLNALAVLVCLLLGAALAMTGRRT